MNSAAENSEIKVKPEINLNVDAVTALNLTVLEYDKKIGEAEAVVSDLKKKRAAFIYDTNIEMLIKQAQQQQQDQQPAPEIQGQPPAIETQGHNSDVLSGPLS